MYVDSSSFFSAIIYFLVSLAIPIGIVYLIIRLTRRPAAGDTSKGATHTTSMTRDLSLVCLLIAGLFVGVLALYQVPVRSFGVESNGASAFIVRLICGFVVLLAGLMLDGIVRNYLLAVSTLVLLAASAYIFTNLGSLGALLALIVAMVVLIAVTVRLSKKGGIRAGGDGGHL